MLKSFEGTSWDKVLPWMLICPSSRYCYARQKDDLWFARISVAPRCDCVPNLDVVTNALDLCFCENRPCFDAKLSDVPPALSRSKKTCIPSHKSLLIRLDMSRSVAASHTPTLQERDAHQLLAQFSLVHHHTCQNFLRGTATHPRQEEVKAASPLDVSPCRRPVLDG